MPPSRIAARPWVRSSARMSSDGEPLERVAVHRVGQHGPERLRVGVGLELERPLKVREQPQPISLMTLRSCSFAAGDLGEVLARDRRQRPTLDAISPGARRSARSSGFGSGRDVCSMARR